ncbi:hypothetical protein KFK09_013118 [Dendrobium nobile]|uniref:Uncharacterized protein n=1 Tax=Dendrobium nobile TaxID=94219 RepID=A0A8T3B6A7_DENNO|nr:hypothetical protein KFK09_013118 [Dendrobium nobile]
MRIWSIIINVYVLFLHLLQLSISIVYKFFSKSHRILIIDSESRCFILIDRKALVFSLVQGIVYIKVLG